VSSSTLRIYGHPLGDAKFGAVIGDIATGRYSDLNLATFMTACALVLIDLPFFFATDAAEDPSASRVVPAAHHLAYLRQDKRFHPGEAMKGRSGRPWCIAAHGVFANGATKS